MSVGRPAQAFDVAPFRLRSFSGAYAVHAGCTLLVSTESAWTVAKTTAMVEETLLAAGYRTPIASVVHFCGGVPGAGSRAAMVSTLARSGAGQPARVASISDSGLLRGAMNAYAWIAGVDMGAFAPGQRREAVDYALAPAPPAVTAEALAVFEQLYELAGVALP